MKNKILQETRVVESHSRRSFLKMGAGLTVGLLAGGNLFAGESPRKLRVVFIGAGNRGRANIISVTKHPKVSVAGFCDVNLGMMKPLRGKYEDAFFEMDYRKVFSEKADLFDAVVMSTPDHMHAPIILHAMALGKHVYAEKPLVNQLDELRMVRKAVAANPQLVTQMGNQRASMRGKVEMADMLSSAQFGRIKEGWVWSQPMGSNRYFVTPNLDTYPASKGSGPGGGAWDLWLGCSDEKLDFLPELFTKRWRSFWEFGAGVIGDWTPHLVDTLVYGLGLQSGPKSVLTHSKREAAKVTYGTDFHSELKFAGVERSGGKDFTIHVSDGIAKPDAKKYGLPEDVKLGQNMFLIETEAGTIVSPATGNGWDIFSKGQSVKAGLEVPTVEKHNHWHDWVDNCLGATKKLWSPLGTGALITELSLLPTKTARFPNRELQWDSEACRFVGHDEANETIVGRAYREGFEVPEEFA